MAGRFRIREEAPRARRSRRQRLVVRVRRLASLTLLVAVVFGGIVETRIAASDPLAIAQASPTSAPRASGSPARVSSWSPPADLDELLGLAGLLAILTGLRVSGLGRGAVSRRASAARLRSGSR